MTRKINTTKLIALLAVLCMITSAFVGSTLAKYTTAVNGSDEARVAKFGVEITANGNMFEKAYDNTVETKGEMDVVAPGTKGTMASMTLSGTPEVDVKVTYDATVELTGWTVDNEFYCPVEVKVNDGEAVSKGSSMDEYKANIEEAIEKYSKEYDANTALNEKGDDSVKVEWSWAFDGDDAKDTALGNAAEAAKIKIDIKTTVTQVD